MYHPLLQFCELLGCLYVHTHTITITKFGAQSRYILNCMIHTLRYLLIGTMLHPSNNTSIFFNDLFLELRAHVVTNMFLGLYFPLCEIKVCLSYNK